VNLKKKKKKKRERRKKEKGYGDISLVGDHINQIQQNFRLDIVFTCKRVNTRKGILKRKKKPEQMKSICVLHAKLNNSIEM